MSLALRLGSLALFGGIALWAWWITARAQLLLTRVEQCLDGIDQLLGDVAWHDEEPASTQEHHLDLAGGLPVGRHAAVERGVSPLYGPESDSETRMRVGGSPEAPGASQGVA